LSRCIGRFMERRLRRRRQISHQLEVAQTPRFNELVSAIYGSGLQGLGVPDCGWRNRPRVSLLALFTPVRDVQEPLERWICSDYILLLPPYPSCRFLYQRTAFRSARKDVCAGQLQILVPL